jgi:hypothetical protein
LAVLLFGAIALGPVYKRTVTLVRAAPPVPAVPAVVILTCRSESGTPAFLDTSYVNNVDVSNPAITYTPPINMGDDCAGALATITQAGFRFLSSTGNTVPFDPGCYAVTTSFCKIYDVTQWTLVRGGGPWNTQ